ncbi:cytochrome oxidase subunit [Klebsiella pneumoniae]|nr:cytochrome oxidase subunit [Klebsiella pneumoniae]
MANAPAGAVIGRRQRNRLKPPSFNGIFMQNVTPMLARKDEREREEPSWSFPGGVVGFVSWWVALAIPFLLYGSNTLFFFLYTWPFFLALLPVSVLVGIATSVLLRGQLLWTMLITALLVICLFWLLFTLLSGW